MQSTQGCISRRSKTANIKYINYKHEYALARFNLPTASFKCKANACVNAYNL